jgi:hypothetical protein
MTVTLIASRLAPDSADPGRDFGIFIHGISHKGQELVVAYKVIQIKRLLP